MSNEKQVVQEEVLEEEFLVNDVESLMDILEKTKKAQEIFATYSQEEVDKIFLAASMAAAGARIPLAQLAVEDTGMGLVEDKVIKNHFASEYIYNAYKDTQTCGVLNESQPFGYKEILEPVGVIAAIVPTTNPTSTAIFKALISLKTRNGLIFSPHPNAKKCTIEAARVVLDAAVEAGAPEGIISWIDEPSIELSMEVMKNADLVLATGGPGMVKSAYSSGKPAVGVGNGNTPALIDKSAKIKMAVSSVIHSKIFDNGVICASEQAVVVDKEIYDEVKEEFEYRGCYFLNEEEKDLLREIILTATGTINAQIVGKTPQHISELAGFTCPPEAKVLIAEVDELDYTKEPFAHEKLSPLLAMYKAETFEEGVDIVDRLVHDGGVGHTSVIYADPVQAADKIKVFEKRMKTGRILINTPSSHGGIGDLYNFRLLPSMTLGCGTWAGNSVSSNVGVKELLNTKYVAERRENMLWFRTPEKVYFKKGSLGVALQELKDVYESKKAFIVTDTFLYNNGYTKVVTDQLDEMGIKHQTFFDVTPDPTLSTAKAGFEVIKQFEPDVIIAVGGGSAMDAAKIMWIMYEHPEADFKDLALRFMDIRKRVYDFPKMRQKAELVCIATTSGTGSEVTPFTIITDDATKTKYSIADYEILPTMAITDADMMLDQPKGLTASSGIDVLTHAVEAYVSMLATDFTDGIALQAMKLVFEYLPRAYKYGRDDLVAREKMAHASALAGMAFANAFLGITHSLAHKLGAHHNVPHGYANALLMTEVIRYNATPTPKRMGAFAQYEYPFANERYAQIADYLGLPGESVEDKVESLILKIEELKEQVGVAKSIEEFGVDEQAFLESLDIMSVEAFDDQCTGTNPRYPLIEELREIYLACYYAKD